RRPSPSHGAPAIHARTCPAGISPRVARAADAKSIARRRRV
ncbi:MAG: hypothetical protein EOQ78_29355, partial [Mesorhizobium sp.]